MYKMHCIAGWISAAVFGLLVTAPCPAATYSCKIDIDGGSNDCTDGIVTLQTSSGTGRVAAVDLEATNSWQSLNVLLEVCDPNAWTQNIGDSPTNNGWGGDNSSTSHDAEAQIKDRNVSVYRSDVGGGGLACSQSNVLPASGCRIVQWTVRDDQVTFDADSDTCDSPDFVCNGSDDELLVTAYDVYDPQDPSGDDEDMWYVGLNRVVNSSSRNGSQVKWACFVLSTAEDPNCGTIADQCDLGPSDPTICTSIPTAGNGSVGSMYVTNTGRTENIRYTFDLNEGVTGGCGTDVYYQEPSGRLGTTEDAQRIIERAMDHWNQILQNNNMSVRFLEDTQDPNVTITVGASGSLARTEWNDPNCSPSGPGKCVTDVKFPTGCWSLDYFYGIALHELGHVLGLRHFSAEKPSQNLFRCGPAETPSSVMSTGNCPAPGDVHTLKTCLNGRAAAIAAACGDGLDNDLDNLIDYPFDLGCSSAADPYESDAAQCADGVDNDGDGLIDHPDDPGCIGAGDNDETDRRGLRWQ